MCKFHTLKISITAYLLLPDMYSVMCFNCFPPFGTVVCLTHLWKTPCIESQHCISGMKILCVSWLKPSSRITHATELCFLKFSIPDPSCSCFSNLDTATKWLTGNHLICTYFILMIQYKNDGKVKNKMWISLCCNRVVLFIVLVIFICWLSCEQVYLQYVLWAVLKYFHI